MLRFSALVPEETVNYILNPSMRYASTDWNANGATLTRSLEQARFGIASLKVVTTGSALREGAFYRVSALSGVSEAITVSAYVRGTGRVRIRLDNNVVGGAEYASQNITLNADRWTRISVTGFSTGGNDLRLFVETDESTPVSRTFYVDGAQMERKPYPTTYCDGDQPECRWNGIYHASTSQRSAATRAGGRWVQLAGEEREAQDLYMTVVNGLGQAPLTNNIQSYALAPGSFFQNKKILARPIVLTFFAKHKVEDEDTPVSLAALHQLRQLLIDVVKPDKTGGDEEIWFEYDDGNTPLYFQARYDGGLEGDWDIRNQFVNQFPLKLLAVSPTLREDSQDVTAIDFQDTFLPNNVAGRINGVWNIMNYGFNDDAVALALGPRGEVYALGQDSGFTTVNNSALAVDPLRTARGITYWDGTKWNALGSVVALGGGPGSFLTAIAVAPNGDVYVTGVFTSIGGVAANNVARWNGSAWSALGAGLNSTGFSISVAPNGDVYVGGSFTTAGGVTCIRIARWDGSSWHRLGQYGGLNDTVLAISISADGTRLYAGGLFTDQNGNPGSGLTRVASYNIETGLFSAMSSGLDASVLVLKISPSGVLHAGGTFLNSGSNSMPGIASWNGSQWAGLAGGVCVQTIPGTCSSVTVRSIAFFSNGNMVVCGEFNRAGGITVNNIALWNGTSWVNLDDEMNLVAADSIYNVLVNPKTDDLYVVWFAAGSVTMKSAGITNVENAGTTEAYPVIYALGPGTLRWIENQTTGKRIYLNLGILNGEEVFFDFARGTVQSTVRGSLFYGVLPGSDFRAFTLAPGVNKIACLMVNDVGAVMQIAIQPLHWSADATQHGEEV